MAKIILDCPLDPAGDHHGPRLTANFPLANHLFVKVIDHDFGFEPDGIFVGFDIPAQFLLRSAGIELRITLDLLDQLVIAHDRRVVLQYIQDKSFLDGLFHGVAMEWAVFDLLSLG